MSNKRKLNIDSENYSTSKRRKINPDSENYKRRKINPDSVIEIKKRQANYNTNSKEYDNNNKEYDNYIEINHCKEAIQMAVDIALKKKKHNPVVKNKKKELIKTKKRIKEKQIKNKLYIFRKYIIFRLEGISFSDLKEFPFPT